VVWHQSYLHHRIKTRTFSNRLKAISKREFQGVSSLFDRFEATRYTFSGSNPPKVKSSLCTVSLQKKPAHGALSYPWGAPDITRPICINTIEVQFTENLHATLKRIRKRKRQYISRFLDRAHIYSHRTATKHLGTLRLALRVYDGVHLTGQIGQNILPCLQFENKYGYSFS